MDDYGNQIFPGFSVDWQHYCEYVGTFGVYTWRCKPFVSGRAACRQEV